MGVILGGDGGGGEAPPALMTVVLLEGWTRAGALAGTRATALVALSPPYRIFFGPAGQDFIVQQLSEVSEAPLDVTCTHART